ncbi:uncharacterized protein LOC135690260 [Rhopilema esculentum]|uniref:uncharacterized protein LOC135690260 n=1 Tax=Rhopilema esculentum TaxID=499914 RepID=UPI0031D62B53
MAGSQYRTKIVGGKLVQVPDFDYVKEYNQGFNPFSQQSFSKYQKSRHNYHKYGSSDGPRFDRGLLDTEKQLYMRNGALPNKLTTSSLDLDQRRSNQLQAERNKRRAQEQLQSSSLVLDPIENDKDENSSENERDNNALAEQVADCLKSTNKQKLAYALRAMTRLDSNGSGYITVREFRDVLLMYQIFIIGGTLEKLVEKYRNNNGKINYKHLWDFVTDSYNATSMNPSTKDSTENETEEAKLFNAAVKRVQKYFRNYSQKHSQAFDFEEITNSLENCDRSRSHLMRIKEIRIICRYYLKIDSETLDVLLEHCDPQNNGWINYYKFINLLKEAQPTYLPPIKHKRRGTFNLDEEVMPSLGASKSDKSIEPLGRDKRGIGDRNNSDGNRAVKGKGIEVKGQKSKAMQGQRSEVKRHLPDETQFDVQRETPRRKWYESEESWMKRKKRHLKPVAKRKMVERKKWEHSAPVRSIKDSHEDVLSDETEEPTDNFEYSDDEMDSGNVSNR